MLFLCIFFRKINSPAGKHIPIKLRLKSMIKCKLDPVLMCAGGIKPTSSVIKHPHPPVRHRHKPVIFPPGISAMDLILYSNIKAVINRIKYIITYNSVLKSNNNQ